MGAFLSGKGLSRPPVRRPGGERRRRCSFQVPQVWRGACHCCSPLPKGAAILRLVEFNVRLDKASHQAASLPQLCVRVAPMSGQSQGTLSMLSARCFSLAVFRLALRPEETAGTSKFDACGGTAAAPPQGCRMAACYLGSHWCSVLARLAWRQSQAWVVSSVFNATDPLASSSLAQPICTTCCHILVEVGGRRRMTITRKILPGVFWSNF